MIPRKKQILNSMARLTSPSREMEVTLTDILLPIDDVEIMTKPRVYSISNLFFVVKQYVCLFLLTLSSILLPQTNSSTTIINNITC